MRSQLITVANPHTLANIQGRVVAGSLGLRLGDSERTLFARRGLRPHDGRALHHGQPKPGNCSMTRKRYLGYSGSCCETATATPMWMAPQSMPIATSVVRQGRWAATVRSGSRDVSR